MLLISSTAIWVSFSAQLLESQLKISPVETAWHSVGLLLFNIATIWLIALQCGTCAMKPRNQGGVVDERLNVYGTTNLKVAGKLV